MLGLEDVVRKHPLTTVSLAAFAITALIPRSKRGPVANGVQAVAKLCIEAEGEAEGEIVEQMAETCVQDLVGAMAHPDPEARHEAVHVAVRKFKRHAHRRSKRFARDEDARQRRYDRHISTLKAKITLRQATAPDAHKQGFDHALSALKTPLEPHINPVIPGRRERSDRRAGNPAAPTSAHPSTAGRT